MLASFAHSPHLCTNSFLWWSPRTGQNLVAGRIADQARKSESVGRWLAYLFYMLAAFLFTSRVGISSAGTNNDHDDHTSAVPGLCGYWHLAMQSQGSRKSLSPYLCELYSAAESNNYNSPERQPAWIAKVILEELSQS